MSRHLGGEIAIGPEGRILSGKNSGTLSPLSVEQTADLIYSCSERRCEVQSTNDFQKVIGMDF